MFLGLRTAVYHAPDLDAATRWYTELLGIEPYFKEPFYVGFNVGGYELGLDPDPGDGLRGIGGNVAFWGVADCDAAHARALALGATTTGGVRDVGSDIRVAIVIDPFGNTLGLIDNPHFNVAH
ncbi:MAG: VOC family protein [Gemmatimonadaceae bacterium]|nr:VOC family protein [Gemmatimonadaceae bacterium]